MTNRMASSPVPDSAMLPGSGVGDKVVSEERFVAAIVPSGFTATVTVHPSAVSFFNTGLPSESNILKANALLGNPFGEANANPDKST